MYYGLFFCNYIAEQKSKQQRKSTITIKAENNWKITGTAVYNCRFTISLNDIETFYSLVVVIVLFFTVFVAEIL